MIKISKQNPLDPFVQLNKHQPGIMVTTRDLEPCSYQSNSQRSCLWKLFTILQYIINMLTIPIYQKGNTFLLYLLISALKLKHWKQLSQIFWTCQSISLYFSRQVFNILYNREHFFAQNLKFYCHCFCSNTTQNLVTTVQWLLLVVITLKIFNLYTFKIVYFKNFEFFEQSISNGRTMRQTNKQWKSCHKHQF